MATYENKQIWDGKKVVTINFTVITDVASGRSRECAKCLSDVVSVAQLSELGNIHTEVDFNPKTRS